MNKPMMDWQSQFATALPYDDFLARHASAGDRKHWSDVFNQFQPSDQQGRVLASFVRQMNVLCLAGAWCGDCVTQCPLLEHLARLGPSIRLRFADRDANPILAAELRLCGGARVPVVVFLSEDYAECGRYGDRTLAQYRQMAGVCPGGISAHNIANDWLREFERIQLMLRLSPRLRQRHGN